MNDFIITLFFGWLGVHKFIQKKNGLGILYLCTLGLFGIGWLIDTFIAFKKLISGKQQKTEGEIREQEQHRGYSIRVNCRMLLKSFDTVIVGTFAKCSLDSHKYREDIIEQISPKCQLMLKYWEYNGEPAYYVILPNGLDAGNVRAGLAKILHEEYNDCELEVTATTKAWDEKNDCPTYNIRIDIYK